MKQKQRLGKGVEWEVLRDLSWTEAQKSFPLSYCKGQVVQFNRHVKGFALGERVEVIDIKDEVVRVRSKTWLHGGKPSRNKQARVPSGSRAVRVG